MKTSHRNMHEMAEQGTFGGTFGGRKSQTETKVSFRGQLRQPNAASTKGGSAAETPFGGRTWFLPKGRNLAPLCISPPNLPNMHIFQPKHAYKFLGASNMHIPHLQHFNHTQSSYIVQKVIKNP